MLSCLLLKHLSILIFLKLLICFLPSRSNSVLSVVLCRLVLFLAFLLDSASFNPFMMYSFLLPVMSANLLPRSVLPWGDSDCALHVTAMYFWGFKAYLKDLNTLLFLHSLFIPSPLGLPLSPFHSVK